MHVFAKTVEDFVRERQRIPLSLICEESLARAIADVTVIFCKLTDLEWEGVKERSRRHPVFHGVFDEIPLEDLALFRYSFFAGNRAVMFTPAVGPLPETCPLPDEVPLTIAQGEAVSIKGTRYVCIENYKDISSGTQDITLARFCDVDPDS